MKSNSKFLATGSVLTIGYLGFITIARYDNTSWWWLQTVPMNELGDALAGVFAPLAFLWLVIGYWMQSEELRLQRKELEENTAALEKQASILEKEFERAVATQQPRLKFSGGSVMGDRRVFTLVNHGQPAIDVIVRLDGLIVFGPTRIRDKADINLVVTDIPEGNSRLQVSYNDAASTLYTMEAIMFSKNGRVVVGELVVPPEEPIAPA